MVKERWDVIIEVPKYNADEFLESLYSVILQEYEPKRVIVTGHSLSQSDLSSIRSLAQRVTNLINVDVKNYNEGNTPEVLNDVVSQLDGHFISVLSVGNIMYVDFSAMVRMLSKEPKKSMVFGNPVQVNIEEVGGIRHVVSKRSEEWPVAGVLSILVNSEVISQDCFVFTKDAWKAYRFDGNLSNLYFHDFFYEISSKGYDSVVFAERNVVDICNQSVISTSAEEKNIVRERNNSRFFYIAGRELGVLEKRYDDLQNTFSSKRFQLYNRIVNSRIAQHFMHLFSGSS